MSVTKPHGVQYKLLVATSAYRHDCRPDQLTERFPGTWSTAWLRRDGKLLRYAFRGQLRTVSQDSLYAFCEARIRDYNHILASGCLSGSDQSTCQAVQSIHRFHRHRTFFIRVRSHGPSGKLRCTLLRIGTRRSEQFCLGEAVVA